LITPFSQKAKQGKISRLLGGGIFFKKDFLIKGKNKKD